MAPVYYEYDPSLPAAVAAASLFSVTFIGTLVQTVRFKAPVWSVMVVAAAMEALGFCMRCISVKDVNSKYQRTFYVTSTSMVVLAPVVMAAAFYICFGRIVFHVVPKPARTLKLLWVSPRWLTPLFVVGDAVALVLQLIGVILVTTGDQAAANAKTRADRGKKFAQSGIALQILFFGLFSVIAVRFNFTSKRFASGFEQRIQPALSEGSELKQETYVTISDCPRKVKRTWQSVLLVTNISSICILVRSVYRFIEFTQGRTGYLARHEWSLYAFDALMIFPVVVLLALFHPGKYLPFLQFRLPAAGR